MPASPAIQAARLRPLPSGSRYLLRYGMAVAAVGIALAIRWLLLPWLGQEAPFLVFVLAVLWAAWYGGSGPGWLATGLSVLAAVYFFLPPFHGFWPIATSGSLQCVVFLGIGGLISVLNARLLGVYRREKAGHEALTASMTQRQQAEDKVRGLNETLEERVEQRTAQLEEANRALQAFGYSVSHDLRAPLRAVQGFAEALLEDHGADLDETGRDYATRIVAAGNRMERLIQDLLAYSRMNQGQIALRVVDLEGVVDEAVSSLLDALRERGGQIAVERPLPAVLAHRPTLTQAVINLLANAVTFVEPGKPPRTRVWAETVDGWLRLWVEDNGIGIAPEHQERIFGVFERLHGEEEYSGTGVGLAIVRKGVERMGGQVGVMSRPNEGSRFWIELRRPKESPRLEAAS
ncbi:MAG TPA: ATP-binding protein [Thermoanaerobaculia bacterium]|nr:ATP-binding protein [Thermoanaerobaculia bacterium]